MNRRRVVAAAAWAIVLLAYTFLTGFALPPHEGTADPDATGPTSSAQLERLMSASTEGSDRFSLTPSTSLHGPTETTVVVAPERSTYPSEDGALDRFMRDGGTLVVFGANTAWNGFLTDYNIRLEGSTLIPTANQTSSNVLTLDLPASLGGGEMLLPNATAVQTSSEDVTTLQPEGETVLDVNGNGTIEVPPDQAGAFPVAGVTSVGEGQLVVIASSEAVLGSSLERNLDATSQFMAAVGGDEASALDAGVHPRGWKDLARAPASATLAVSQASWAGLAALVAVAIGTVVALPRRTEADRDSVGLDEFTPQTREVMLDRGD